MNALKFDIYREVGHTSVLYTNSTLHVHDSSQTSQDRMHTGNMNMRLAPSLLINPHSFHQNACQLIESNSEGSFKADIS